MTSGCRLDMEAKTGLGQKYIYMCVCFWRYCPLIWTLEQAWRRNWTPCECFKCVGVKGDALEISPSKHVRLISTPWLAGLSVWRPSFVKHPLCWTLATYASTTDNWINYDDTVSSVFRPQNKQNGAFRRDRIAISPINGTHRSVEGKKKKKKSNSDNYCVYAWSGWAVFYCYYWT